MKADELANDENIISNEPNDNDDNIIKDNDDDNDNIIANDNEKTNFVTQNIIKKGDDDFDEEEPLKIDVLKNARTSKLDDDEFEKDFKADAKTNLDTIARAFGNHFEAKGLNASFFARIIRENVPDWEAELGNCSTEHANIPSVTNLNEDLRDFMLKHTTDIQPLIDEALEN